MNKHDKYVKCLAEKLRMYYDSVHTHVVIENEKRRLGEIDILAQKGERTDVFEVKCSHRITKARHQFKKIKKNLSLDNANFYFFCGSSSKTVQVFF